MNVIALKAGFYAGRRIRKGQRFDVPDGTKGKWFEPSKVEVKRAEVKDEKGAKGAKAQGPKTFSDIAKQDHKDLTPKGEKTDDLV